MSSLVSFLPHYLVQDLARHPSTSPVGREQRFNAVALFADISGFTPLSEALGNHGKGGTEELNALLNAYFTRMISLIHSYGGIVTKFGGDALTVLFPCDAPFTASIGKAARRALGCALAMQEAMPDYQSVPTIAGPFNLGMKAGLALGPVFCSTVGEVDTRLEYIVAGRVLERCAEAEHHAQQGEVVAHTALRDCSGSVEFLPLNADVCRVVTRVEQVEPEPFPA